MGGKFEDMSHFEAQGWLIGEEGWNVASRGMMKHQNNGQQAGREC